MKLLVRFSSSSPSSLSSLLSSFSLTNIRPTIERSDVTVVAEDKAPRDIRLAKLRSNSTTSLSRATLSQRRPQDHSKEFDFVAPEMEFIGFRALARGVLARRQFRSMKDDAQRQREEDRSHEQKARSIVRSHSRSRVGGGGGEADRIKMGRAKSQAAKVSQSFAIPFCQANDTANSENNDTRAKQYLRLLMIPKSIIKKNWSWSNCAVQSMNSLKKSSNHMTS
jgi:hypothetical protein